MKTLEPRQARSVATREKLLETALAVLVEKGYGETSTVAVCERAQASRGQLLHHFPNKASLLAAAVDLLFERMLSGFRAEFAGRAKAEPRTVLKALWRVYTEPAMAAWQELVAAARHDAELRARVAEVDRRITAEAEDTFRALFPAVSPARLRPLTRLILATFDGLALNRVASPDDLNARRVLRELEAVLEAL